MLPKTPRTAIPPQPIPTLERQKGPFTVPGGYFGLSAIVYCPALKKAATIVAGDMESLRVAWDRIAPGIALDESRVQRVMLAADVRG